MRQASPSSLTFAWTASIFDGSVLRASRRRTCSWKRPGSSRLPPARAVVFEDAVVGVEAGRAGRFRLVVGIGRGDHAVDLRAHGADIVVADLRELSLEEQGDKAMTVHASGATHAKAVEASRESCSLLTINGGSSSIRFALYEEGEPLRRLLDGKVDRVGLSGTNLIFKDSTGQSQDSRTIDRRRSPFGGRHFYWIGSKRSRCSLRSKPWDTAWCMG